MKHGVESLDESRRTEILRFLQSERCRFKDYAFTQAVIHEDIPAACERLEQLSEGRSVDGTVQAAAALSLDKVLAPILIAVIQGIIDRP